MLIRSWFPVLLLAAAAGFPRVAWADTLVASRPGLMCSSAEALSRLTLPGGGSRTAAPGATSNDFAIKEQGGCIDIPIGAQVAVQAMRRQTSIILFDAHDGKGTRSFVVPNIDFSAAAASSVAVDGACLSYNTPVTLRGTVTVGSTYGERLDGTVGTSRWQQITLDRPICIRESPATDEEAERNVRALQPVWMGSGTHAFVTGRHVTLDGKLFHQDNGHQMTRVLIDVGHASDN